MMIQLVKGLTAYHLSVVHSIQPSYLHELMILAHYSSCGLQLLEQPLFYLTSGCQWHWRTLQRSTARADFGDCFEFRHVDGTLGREEPGDVAG